MNKSLPGQQADSIFLSSRISCCSFLSPCLNAAFLILKYVVNDLTVACVQKLEQVNNFGHSVNKHLKNCSNQTVVKLCCLLSHHLMELNWNRLNWIILAYVSFVHVSPASSQLPGQLHGRCQGRSHARLSTQWPPHHHPAEEVQCPNKSDVPIGEEAPSGHHAPDGWGGGSGQQAHWGGTLWSPVPWVRQE